MQAIEFQPSLKIRQIEAESEEEMAWGKLTAESFLNGFLEIDSIYDDSRIAETGPEKLVNDIKKAT